jgi:hypothetical protein
MTAGTHSLTPVSVTVSKKSAVRMAWASELWNVAQVPLVRCHPRAVLNVDHRGLGVDLPGIASAISPGAK